MTEVEPAQLRGLPLPEYIAWRDKLREDYRRTFRPGRASRTAGGLGLGGLCPLIAYATGAA